MCVLSPAMEAHAANTMQTNADADPGPPLPQPDDLRKQLDAIPAKLTEDTDARKLLGQLNGIGAAAERLAKQRTSELADVDGRLAGLGPTPEKGSPADAPDVAEQRATLNKQRSAIDSDLKLARLIGVDAEQRSADILKQRRAQFQATLTARVESPLTPSFWKVWKLAARDDLERLQMLGDDLRATAAEATSTPRKRNNFALHMLGALLLIIGGTWAAERILVRVLPSRLPSGRLRRTLMASIAVVLNVLIVTLAVKIAWNGLRLNAEFDEPLQALESICLQMAAYGSYVIALGHSLLSSKRSTWRLLLISDDLARRLSPFPWWFALSSALGGVATEVSAIAGLSISSEVLVHIVSALLAAFITLSALRHLRTPDSQMASADEPKEAAAESAAQLSERPWWFGMLAAAAGVALIAVVVLAALGFVALAATIARQMVWTMVVLSTMYLLFKLTDDLCESLLSSHGGFGSRVQASLGIDAKLLDQVAVLASGVLRVALFFYMVIALMAPLGTAPDEVFRRGSSVDHSLKFGDFTIAPQALLTAAAVICLGFFAIHLFKRWLTNQFFPNTSLEPGMRSSITTLMGYVSGVVVIAAALAGLGISVERIAWVASALSVGIGFGLQAIVQNFISGLILLAERPVRVGDWVKLGDTEGDVRRVNVRATEIQLSDRSTMIVPNSEFITKSVRNMTLAGAPGRVMLNLPAPLDTDAPRMRQIILEAYTSHPSIQDSPAPVVQLEGIQNGTLMFLAIGYIGNPRNTGSVRSDLLFEILKSLREAGLHLSPPATTSITSGTGPTPPGSSGDPVIDQLTNPR
ncbi:mechanosensitive ion channel family protein [Diaphorobacter sp. NR2-3-3-1]|nr:mechanosensitive ion channel family protein [Diaphorobacter caeni]